MSAVVRSGRRSAPDFVVERGNEHRAYVLASHGHVPFLLYRPLSAMLFMLKVLLY